MDECTIQIRSRNEKYFAAYESLVWIKKTFEGIGIFISNASKYIGIWASTNIIFLKRDEEDRHIFVLNFKVIRELSKKDSGYRQVI